MSLLVFGNSNTKLSASQRLFVNRTMQTNETQYPVNSEILICKIRDILYTAPFRVKRFFALFTGYCVALRGLQQAA